MMKNENLSIVSMGTVSGSLVHPREIFKAAVLSNASGIFLAHNHPGGSLVPSQDDLQVTQRIYEAGELMGIPLLDHLISTDRGYTSVRSQYGDLRRVNGNLTAETVRESASGKTQQAKVKELTEQLEQGIEKLFQSNQYKAYLDTIPNRLILHLGIIIVLDSRLEFGLRKECRGKGLH